VKYKSAIIALATLSTSLYATDNQQLQREIMRLQQQTKALEVQLSTMQKQLAANSKKNKPLPKQEHKIKHSKRQRASSTHKAVGNAGERFHTTHISVHTPIGGEKPERYYPTALIANGKVITYIAGTPVVTSPYTGQRPAFDGSDYIVNISSINRDIRLMEQRRKVYKAYEEIGYTPPKSPILALSGKSEPVAVFGSPYLGQSKSDLSLGSNELDLAAALNDHVEAFMALAYDESPPVLGGPRVTNSAFYLNLGFVNIGDLDESPFYFTAGQLYAPFGRYSSSMISSPITMILARTRTRPFIFGYKSQTDSGPYAAAYAFSSETTLGHRGVGGFNAGYTIHSNKIIGDIGAGLIGSIDDSQGMQRTRSAPGTTFGGFGSLTNGSEAVGKVPAVDFHANFSFDRYSLTAEWVGASRPFNPMDLSFNGYGAKPQAAQLEGGVTFLVFEKPASLALGYQWSKDTLALNLPEHRLSGVFNISVWKDTVESLEYRHDIDFSASSYANGASAPGQVNANTLGTGKSADTLIAQIGVFF